MQEILELEYKGVKENKENYQLIKNVLEVCFNTEKIAKSKIYVNIILTTPKEIQAINKTYRNIDKPTDVLSFPMFEKSELQEYLTSKDNGIVEVLGDIVISIDKVIEQAEEYGHSFERELSYMLVHGFYHLMGYDHIEEEDKKVMRPKEEKILSELKIVR